MLKLEEITDWKQMINQVVWGDCLEGMKLIPDGAIDLVLTDPPYGINYNAQKLRVHKTVRNYNDIKGDSSEMNLSFLLNRKERKIIFGANNFNKQLSTKGAWLVWDKRVVASADLIRGSHFELAWLDWGAQYKIYRIQHCGAINADASKPGQQLPRRHPTQKPVELMRQIILDYTKEGDLICDPFMGSWTTARACKDLGRDFIGFEIEEDYCEVGEERLKQQNLF